jgi:hypothetical protein
VDAHLSLSRTPFLAKVTLISLIKDSISVKRRFSRLRKYPITEIAVPIPTSHISLYSMVILTQKKTPAEAGALGREALGVKN